MTRDEFLTNFKDILQTDADINFDTKLSDIEEWDSLAQLSTSAFFDSDFGVRVSLTDFESMNSVNDLAEKVGL